MTEPAPRLPLWPLLAMFGFVPLWWVLGVFYFGWPAFGLLLLAFMALRGGIELPRGTGWWLVFLALAGLSVVRLGAASELLTFSLRLGFYATALIVCVYVYNLLRERRPIDAVLRPLMYFWLSLVALGWAGVLVPELSVASPMQRLLPGGLASVPFVHDLVHLTTAEVSLASVDPIFRPSGPFAYTNNWGSAFALLVPCVVAYLYLGSRGRLRIVLMASLPLSLPPALLTLNRGMFLSLGVALLFLVVRSLMRGQWATIAGAAAVAGLFWAATRLIPVGELIDQRVDSSDTNTDRMSLYVEAWRLAQTSPVIGFGRPTTLDTVTAEAPVGTQGQLWLVLISHGFPALVCFGGYLVVALSRCVRNMTPAGQWLAVVPLIALAQLPFYGLTYQNLTVVFFAIGVALSLVEVPPLTAPSRPLALVGAR